MEGAAQARGAPGEGHGGGPGGEPLAGRVAVVTGASSGIGAATARRLAARGLRVVLGARRLDRLEALGGELCALREGAALAVALDVTDRASVAAFAGRARDFAGEGGVRILVNNAGMARGVTRLPDAQPADEDDWEAMLDVNVMGLLRVTRAFVPEMAARGAGHVVNVGSLAGLETYEGGAVYCASKAAVRVLSKALRLELLGRGVRVSCVNPGLVSGNEFSLVRLRDPERARAVYAGMTPLDSDDVAAAIEWLATLPPHVNVDELDLRPRDQASAQKVHRRPAPEA